MKVVFDHVNGFGKVSDQDFIYSQPHGVLEEGENPADALAQGWIPWDGDWYNLRSVRINLDHYKPHETTKRIGKKIKTVYALFEDTPEYREIYQKYLDYHGYERTITWEQLFTGNVLLYHYEGKLIGYSLVEVYGDSMVATQFVWDYEEPKLSLGRVAQMQECYLAKEMGLKYVYILGGYEECCMYKADFYGFEFWTGINWLDDKKLFKELCKRDESATVRYDDI
jgi:arginyl-tRNA--protein-N-Asp/Glu arginylyltransferase